MEADWEFEIGDDTPIIEANWDGFIDLRAKPSRAGELAESLQLLGLAEALARLNARHSPVWTCKTDVFVPERIDPDELNAEGEEGAHGLACYIDLLPQIDERWDVPSKAETACRELCERLREMPLRRCRIDLVIRLAYIEPDINDLGATAYFTACGSSEKDAQIRLAECLRLFTASILRDRNEGIAG